MQIVKKEDLHTRQVYVIVTVGTSLTTHELFRAETHVCGRETTMS